MRFNGREILLSVIICSSFQTAFVYLLITLIFGLLEIDIEGKELVVSFLCVWMGIGAGLRVILGATRHC